MGTSVTLLYDLTRLISRRNAPTPTGIDRVDLRLARHMRQRFGTACLGVCQVQGRLMLVAPTLTRTLLATLDEQWSGRAPPNLALDAEVRQAGLVGTEPPAPANDTARRGDSRATPGGEVISADHITYLFNLDYRDRVRFVVNNDLSKYLPNGLHWFGRLPRPLRWLLVAPVLTTPDRLRRAAGTGLRLLNSRSGQRTVQKTKPVVAAVTPNSSLDSALVRQLERSRDSEICYLNMSHHGLDNRPVFSELYTVYQAHFIIFIHDIIPIEYPEYVRPGDDVKHSGRLTLVAELQPYLIFNSEDTRRRVLGYLGSLGFAAFRSTVSYVGVEPHLLSPAPRRARLRTGVTGPYFITVGTIEGRKNHLILLQVWREMVARSDGGAVPKLVICGRRGWENEAATAMLDRCPALRGHVVELSGVDDRRLADLISGARALLFPSFSEGWGMPLVEALARGVPVICSDIPVFREAGQMVPDYLDPLDAPGWMGLISDYAADDSPRRRAQLQRMAAFVVPEWEQSLARLDADLDAAFGWAGAVDQRLSA